MLLAQNKVCGWPLGAKTNYSFAAPAVWDPVSAHYFAVMDRRGSGAAESSSVLVSWPPKPPGAPLSHLPTAPLPSAAHSVFPATASASAKSPADAMDVDDRDDARTATGGAIVVSKSGDVWHYTAKGQRAHELEPLAGAAGASRSLLLTTVASVSAEPTEGSSDTRVVLVSAAATKQGAPTFKAELCGLHRVAGSASRCAPTATFPRATFPLCKGLTDARRRPRPTRARIISGGELFGSRERSAPRGRARPPATSSLGCQALARWTRPEGFAERAPLRVGAPARRDASPLLCAGRKKPG